MFTHLHVHTEYSLLDGLSRIEPLVRRAKELDMGSLAITDHGVLHGAIDFYHLAREAGIKPIIGCEMYVAPSSRYGKGPEDKTPFHLTVLAKDLTGYRNLVKLVSASHLEGFYYKPRVDRELLERHHQGLVVLSGCPSGEVPKLIAQDQLPSAREAATWYKEVFGDYYLELMEHGLVEELPAINKGLMELHSELDIPVVATNDAHYVHREEAPLQDILICIHTNTNIQDERRLRIEEDSYYLRSPEEMSALYPDNPEAITNTQRIAEMCNLELDLSQMHLPQFKLPEGLAADDYLANLCQEGLRRLIQDAGHDEDQRLTYELEVIKQTRLANYFLVVWDIARFARESGILFAVRGSAAASLALYCLGVTDINPLQYRMVFERFLHVERKELPDVDLDFQDDRREEVINYLVTKYGRDHVAQIITFGTLGARASIRDVGRALGMPYADVDAIARLVPTRLHVTLDEALETPEFQEVYGADEQVKKLVDTARSLEGVVRHPSTHAAGLVISEEPLDTYVPLQRPIKNDENGITMTQYSMEPVAALGLLKLDILGLANLTVLAKALELISGTRDLAITLSDIPLDDSKTFEMLSAGDTVGVFQLEGAGMTRYIKELKPSAVGDVAAMIALYRPGPMEHISTFINAKHGLTEAQYPHQALKDILEETYGVIVYQDQVLLIVQTFAGYSAGEADILRKAMGKKIPQIMAEEREKFIAGALNQGFARKLAEEMFVLIEPFAGYAFNKAHAVSYGLISYWTAYLKANYPTEYMVCLLNAFTDNSEKVAVTVLECRRMGLPVLHPDINMSQVQFSIDHTEDGKDAVRFGLASIKNVGPAAVQPVIDARATEGSFASLEHICRTADLSSLNRKAMESLIKAGVFDASGDRKALLESVERILALAQSEAELRRSDQASMFDLLGESVPTAVSHIPLSELEASTREIQLWETELLGVSLSGSDTLYSLAHDAGSEVVVFRSDVKPEMAGTKVSLVGQVARASHRLSREQKRYAIVSLALLDGEIEVFVWGGLVEETQGLWEEGTLLTVVGSVRNRDDRVSISCISARPYTLPDEDQQADGQDGAFHPTVGPENLNVTHPPARPSDGLDRAGVEEGRPTALMASPVARRNLTLRIRETGRTVEDQQLLADVRTLLLEHPGEDSVSLEIAVSGRVVTLEWPVVGVEARPELEVGLRQLLGSAGRVGVEDSN